MVIIGRGRGDTVFVEASFFNIQHGSSFRQRRKRFGVPNDVGDDVNLAWKTIQCVYDNVPFFDLLPKTLKQVCQFLNLITICMDGQVSQRDSSQSRFELHGNGFFVVIKDRVKVLPHFASCGFRRVRRCNERLEIEPNNQRVTIIQLFPLRIQ